MFIRSKYNAGFSMFCPISPSSQLQISRTPMWLPVHKSPVCKQKTHEQVQHANPNCCKIFFSLTILTELGRPKLFLLVKKLASLGSIGCTFLTNTTYKNFRIQIRNLTNEMRLTKSCLSHKEHHE